LPSQASNPLTLSPLIGAIVLLVLLAGRVILTWLSPQENPGLRFSEADIGFLFAAPVTRRMLIQYNLLSSQFTILLSSLCLTLIADRWSYLGGNPLTHAIGWWVILSTVNLQFVGAPLTLAQISRRGVSGPNRRIVGAALLGLFVAASAFFVWRHAHPPGPSDMAGPAQKIAYAASLLDVGPLHGLLALLKVVFGPFLAPGWRAFLFALGPALLLLAAQYFWVVRMETSFEEGSIALAHKTAQSVAARREGRQVFNPAPNKTRREPFRLADRGWPEFAFLWKNLLSTWSGFKPRTLLVTAFVILLSSKELLRHQAGRDIMAVLGVLVCMLAGFTVVLGPQYFRQDLRGDLANADILKTYPLPGWRVVLGELLAPIAILACLWWLELLALGFALPGPAWMTPGLRLPFFLCLGVLAPPICALQLLVPNAGALLFPAWFQVSRNRTIGIDAVGQRLIFMFGLLLATAVALLPVVLAAGLLIFATQWLIGLGAAMAIATAAALAILIGELGLGIWWLGSRFEKFDPATDLRS
jgi:hypothetical protein